MSKSDFCSGDGASQLETSKCVEVNTESIPRYKVILYNDNTNTMIKVTGVLCKVFSFDITKSKGIMMTAHNTGRAVCGVFPYELAELKRDQLRSQRLGSDIEKA